MKVTELLVPLNGVIIIMHMIYALSLLQSCEIYTLHVTRKMMLCQIRLEKLDYSVYQLTIYLQAESALDG